MIFKIIVFHMINCISYTVYDIYTICNGSILIHTCSEFTKNVISEPPIDIKANLRYQFWISFTINRFRWSLTYFLTRRWFKNRFMGSLLPQLAKIIASQSWSLTYIWSGIKWVQYRQFQKSKNKSMRLSPGKWDEPRWDYSLQIRDFKLVSVGVLVTEFEFLTYFVVD